MLIDKEITKICKYNITMQLVEEQDAQFIVDLRTDERNRHISKTDPDTSKQVEWIKRYKIREETKVEYYFIVKDSNGIPWGTTRLYNFEENKFEVGSWVFLINAPNHIAIKSDILAREIAFETLGFDICKFEVRKDNKKVLRYHHGYKPNVVAEDDLNFYFELDKLSFYKHRDKLLKLL
jgi:hypothetical protein